MIKSINKVLISAICFSILASCNSVVPNSVTNVNNNTVSSEQFLDKNIAGLAFSKISEKDATILNSNVLITDNKFKTSGSISASVAPMTSSVAPMVDSRMSSASSYFQYPGYFQEYVVTDFEEASTKGYVGTYIATLNDIVKPIIKDWDTSARLISSNGNTLDKGTNESLKQPSYDTTEYNNKFYSPYEGKWQFIFASTEKREIYNITVTPDETLVIRQKWGLLDLDYSNIATDSNKSIEISLKAIRDKSFTIPQKEDIVSASDPNSTIETLYDIPKDKLANWYFYLEKENGNLIWNINLNIYDIPQAMNQIDTATNCVSSSLLASDPKKANELLQQVEVKKVTNTYVNGGYVKINAKTGEILSLSRPTKNTYTYDNVIKQYICAEPVQTPYQTVNPSETAIPVPSPTATSQIINQSATPTPELTSTPNPSV